MEPRHIKALGIIAGSAAAATALVEGHQHRGAIVRWVWSMTGFAVMPDEVSISIAIVIMTAVFAAILFLTLK